MTASALLRRFGSTALSLSYARLWNSFLSELRLKGTSNSPRRPLCGPHLFGKCGALASAIRDAEAVTLLRAAAPKENEKATSRPQTRRLNEECSLVMGKRRASTHLDWRVGLRPHLAALFDALIHRRSQIRVGPFFRVAV